METMPPERKTFHVQNPKFVFGFILLLAVVGVGASGYRISRGINGGFVPTSNGNTNQALDASSSDSDLALKTKDTDNDGITDYDELNVYTTSPYLADTDSDGIGDNDEIAKGSDPNCPEGVVCKEVAPSTPADSSDLDEDITSQATQGLNSEAESNGEISDAAEITTQEDANAQLKNLTAGQIRQLLLDSGQVTQVQLNGISDEELMRVYREIVAQ